MQEHTETLTLRKGENHILVLPGLGSAGYQWTVQAADREIVSITEMPLAAGEVRAVIQGSVEERFRLTALAPGETVIRLTQMRRFGTEPPHATREIALTILQ